MARLASCLGGRRRGRSHLWLLLWSCRSVSVMFVSVLLLVLAFLSTHTLMMMTIINYVWNCNLCICTCYFVQPACCCLLYSFEECKLLHIFAVAFCIHLRNARCCIFFTTLSKIVGNAMQAGCKDSSNSNFLLENCIQSCIAVVALHCVVVHYMLVEARH